MCGLAAGAPIPGHQEEGEVLTGEDLRVLLGRAEAVTQCLAGRQEEQTGRREKRGNPKERHTVTIGHSEQGFIQGMFDLNPCSLAG